MDLKLSDTQLNEMLQVAVIQALGDDAKALIIEQAIGYLMKPQKDYRGQETVSPLLEAVQRATRNLAEKIVEERLAADQDFRVRLDEVFHLAVEKTFGDKELLATKLAEALRKAISGDRY